MILSANFEKIRMLLDWRKPVFVGFLIDLDTLKTYYPTVVNPGHRFLTSRKIFFKTRDFSHHKGGL